jgi:hypothetical protein
VRPAGAVDAPVLARVYDAGREQRRRRDVAYVIREWATAPAARGARAATGRTTPAAAVRPRDGAARGPRGAHAAGLRTAASTPATSCSTARAPSAHRPHRRAALPDGPWPRARRRPGPVEADVRDAAAVLYALLTRPLAGLPARRSPRPACPARRRCATGPPPAAGSSARGRCAPGCRPPSTPP